MEYLPPYLITMIGKFYESLEVKVFDTFVEITTSLPYARYLLEKYGDDILGIQEEFLEEFLKDNFNKEYRLRYEQFTKS